MYRRKGDTEKMILNYLNSLAHNPNRLNSMKTLFQRYLSEDDFLELQTQLYTRIQDNDEVVAYPELLTWVFIQKKDYKNALRQVKALDRRLKENGGRIYRLAEIAANDKDYDAAIVAYNYIVREKGKMSSYYIESKRESLTCKRKKLVEGFDYTDQDLKTLEAEYQFFLNEFGKRKSTASIVAELADLEAFYLNDLDKAIFLLQEMIEYRGLNRYILAKGKLSLADFYLMKGEVWESTLLYSQVDKEFKDDILGHEARFRNAKLSYYSGDYQWAQAQFDILKASTSKLIANDALDLKLLISDNKFEDSTQTALRQYAKADLMAYQNKNAAAIILYDKLLKQYQGQSIEDEALFNQAKLLVAEQQYEMAVTNLLKIISIDPEGILTDNSYYLLGEIYKNNIKDFEKASEYYQKIIFEKPSSIYLVDARQKYREIRGDNIE